MQSRQIQLFGIIGTAVLILFTVIFFGKDFYHLYLNFTRGTTLPSLSDEQIVMEAEAVKNLQERLDKEAAPMLKKFRPELKSEKSISEMTTGVVETTSIKKVESHLSKAEQQSVSSVQQEPPSVQKSEKSISQESAVTLPVLNREIRLMMRQVPFFRHSMALTKENKAILDQIVEKIELLSKPFHIVVEGHTEASVSKNTSETMAMRVKQYLIQKLPDVEIESVGYGNDYPIIDEANNKENRRVEILIRRDEK